MSGTRRLAERVCWAAGVVKVASCPAVGVLWCTPRYSESLLQSPSGDVFWWLVGWQLGLAFRQKFLGQPHRHWIQLICSTSPVSLDTNLMPVPCYKLTLIDTIPPHLWPPPCRRCSVSPQNYNPHLLLRVYFLNSLFLLQFNSSVLRGAGKRIQWNKTPGRVKNIIRTRRSTKEDL